MSELTISNVIKMIVAILVIAVVVLGVYFGFTNYVIPFFKGLGFGDGVIDDDGFDGGLEEKSICDGKNVVIIIKEDKDLGGYPHDYFYYRNSKVNAYLEDNLIYSTYEAVLDDEVTSTTTIAKEQVGSIIDNQIKIDIDQVKGLGDLLTSLDKSAFEMLDDAYISNNEVCKEV